MKMRIVDELRDIIEGANAMAYLPVPAETVPKREVMADKWELLLEFFEEQRNRRSLDADSPVEFLGPRQSGNRAWLYVLMHGEYDNLALMGSITAAKRPGEHAWLAFRLDGFPDPDLFRQTVDDLIEEMRRQGFIASQPTTPGEEGAGDEVTDTNRLLSDSSTMRQYYKDYNPVTARGIITAMPRAWALWCEEGGRWGPGYIARVYSLNSTTIGRYLGAFKRAGIHEVDGIEIP